jgi:hypothetical protein
MGSTHNLKVVGSNPTPATILKLPRFRKESGIFFVVLLANAEISPQIAENPPRLALFGLFPVPDDSPDDSTLQKAGFGGFQTRK